MKKYIILGLIALVVAIGAGYGIINKMQQQEIALSERAMLNLEALARGESPPGGCENPPPGDDDCWEGWERGFAECEDYVLETEICPKTGRITQYLRKRPCCRYVGGTNGACNVGGIGTCRR